MQPKWLSLLKVQVDAFYAMVKIWLSDDNHHHTVWTQPYCMASFIMSIRGLKCKLEEYFFVAFEGFITGRTVSQNRTKPSYNHFLWYSWLQQSCADVD